MSSSGGGLSGDGRSLFVFVGDVSADVHTGRLLSRLAGARPDVRVWGVGGSAMADAGAELLHRCEDLACFGVIEVLRFLPVLHKLRADLLDEIERRRPAAALLVDFGGFNLRLASSIRKRFPDLPIIYFISPQVWASRPWRINTISRTVSKMLVIFPFEEELYRSRGIKTRFVGHPLAEELKAGAGALDADEFRRRHSLALDRKLIGIFPGSRKQEVKNLLPVVLEAADWLLRQRPDVRFAISQANPLLASVMDEEIDRRGYRRLVGNGLTLIPPGEGHGLMAASDFLWAKSGTTTLEAALFGKPMLIFYRGNWLSYLLFLLFKRVKHVGWPNLLAGRMVVPELIQLDCRPAGLVRYTSDWLDVPALREEVAETLMQVRNRLGEGDFVETAATEILSVLGRSEEAEPPGPGNGSCESGLPSGSLSSQENPN